MKKNLVECKSLGIPLREDIARELDAMLPKLPKECRKLSRKGALPDTAELIKGERADISLVSVESVDRDSEVVLAKGMDLTYFQKNPVVMFAHNYSDLPVGKAAWIKKVEGGLQAKTIYSDATETARACWQLTQEGILKGKSIGFLPTLIRSPTKEEVSRHPEWKDAQAVIESAILLEFSIAPIPCNQDSLVQAVAKGLADHATLVKLGLVQAKKVKPVDYVKLLAKHLDKLKLDPEKIVRRILDRFEV